MLPDVGSKKARALLNHFGSIERVITASEDELRGVPFIGNKTATMIREIVRESPTFYGESASFNVQTKKDHMRSITKAEGNTKRE